MSTKTNYPEFGVVPTSLVEVDGSDVQLCDIKPGTYVRCWCNPIMGMRPIIVDSYLYHHYDYGYRISFRNKDFGMSSIVVGKDQEILVVTGLDNKTFTTAEDLHFDLDEGKTFYTIFGSEIVSVTEEESIECVHFDTSGHMPPVIGGIICGTHHDD